MQVQEAASERTGDSGGVSRQAFSILLAMARRSFTKDELRVTFGMTSSEVVPLLDSLHRKRLVTVLPGSDCADFEVALRLTELGEKTLLHEMERMCELPE